MCGFFLPRLFVRFGFHGSCGFSLSFQWILKPLTQQIPLASSSHAPKFDPSDEISLDLNGWSLLDSELEKINKKRVACLEKFSRRQLKIQVDYEKELAEEMDKINKKYKALFLEVEFVDKIF